MLQAVAFAMLVKCIMQATPKLARLMGPKPSPTTFSYPTLSHKE